MNNFGSKIFKFQFCISLVKCESAVLDIICSLDRSWEVLPTNGQLYFHIIMQANYSGLDETKVQTQNTLCFKTQGHNFL